MTSIVEMYRLPLASGRNEPSLRSTGSLYYDYSEEFENQTPMPIEPAPPLCPIPQRAGSLHRPMVLRAEDQECLGEPTSTVGMGQVTDRLNGVPGTFFSIHRNTHVR